MSNLIIVLLPWVEAPAPPEDWCCGPLAEWDILSAGEDSESGGTGANRGKVWLATLNPQQHLKIIKKFIIFINWSRCSTCPLALVFGCCELSHVIFLKLRKKELLGKLRKFSKWQLLKMVLGWLSFWVKLVVILRICSALQAFCSFSAWEKSTQLATAKN